MNFTKAMAAKTKEERERLIEDEISGYAWGDEVEDYLLHGGWPDDINVYKISIDDSDENEIEVIAYIEFTESVPSSCHDYNHEHPGSAVAKVMIDRESATYDIETEGQVQDIEPDDDEDGEWPYFLPDDGPEEF